MHTSAGSNQFYLPDEIVLDMKYHRKMLICRQ